MNQSLPFSSKTSPKAVPQHASRTELVLGGGVFTGSAWLIGV
jgi:hypothetical protein